MLKILCLFLCTAAFGWTASIPKKPLRWDTWPYYQKVRWRGEHLDPRIDYALYADKLAVKQLVEGDMAVAKVLFATDDPDTISLVGLPKSFVMKANNGSNRSLLVIEGMVVSRKKGLAYEACPVTDDTLRSYATSWLRTPYMSKREKQYGQIKPMVFIEEYIDGIALEINVHSFYGKAQLIGITLDEIFSKTPLYAFYDLDWNLLPMRRADYPPLKKGIERPKRLEEIIQLTEKLTKQFDYVRVDFLLKGDEIYFGEFTFTPDAGKVRYVPPSFESQLSHHWLYPHEGALSTPALDKISL